MEQLPAAVSVVTTELAKNCESAFVAALDSRKLAAKADSAAGGSGSGGVFTSIHRKPYRGNLVTASTSNGCSQAVAQSSPYVKTMAKHLAHCRIEWLSKFNPPPTSGSPSIGRRLVERLVYRILGFFVRHVALIRPLSQGGKLQLAKDTADIREAVATSLLPPDAEQAAYQGLRAFRRLLFPDTSVLIEQQQQYKEGQGQGSALSSSSGLLLLT